MFFRGAQILVGLTLAAGAMLTGSARAADFDLSAVGVRFGFATDPADLKFHQAEAFAFWDLPLAMNLGRDWAIQPKATASLGWLGNSSNNNAAIGTAGFCFALERVSLPFSFEIGLCPTCLSRDDFTTKDFGTLLQFTTWAGINADLGEKIQIRYRLQHMSNGGFKEPNWGLNLHMLGVSYRF